MSSHSIKSSRQPLSGTIDLSFHFFTIDEYVMRLKLQLDQGCSLNVKLSSYIIIAMANVLPANVY